MFIALLPTPDQATERPARQRVAAQSAGARLALAAAAEAAGCADMEFEKQDDVPQPWNGWHWSVSHDDTWVMGALARAPIGVDLERIQMRRAALREAVLNAREQALLGRVDALGFTRLWTGKEAVLKAAGVGLTRLSHCRLDGVPPEHLVHVPELAGQVLPLTLDGEPAPVLQFRWHEHVLALYVHGGEDELRWILPPDLDVSCRAAESLPS